MKLYIFDVYLLLNWLLHFTYLIVCFDGLWFSIYVYPPIFSVLLIYKKAVKFGVNNFVMSNNFWKIAAINYI